MASAYLRPVFPVFPVVSPVAMFRVVVVPKSVLKRMERITDKDEAREEGLAIARETLVEVRELVQGVQVSAPFGRVQYALDVFSVLWKETNHGEHGEHGERTDSMASAYLRPVFPVFPVVSPVAMRRVAMIGWKTL